MPEIENDAQFLSGGGQMGELIRSMDWSKTALGPVNEWPQSLRTSVSLCLSSTFPILIAWGPELIQIYNDSYRPICGAKHPQSMGENFKICWETALPVVGDKFDRGLAGEGTYIKDQQMLLDRYGYIEEAFMTFSFAPIRDESGEVGGIFHPITETTDQILSARRTQVLRDLAVHTGNAKTNEEILESLGAVLNQFNYDVPFVQIYELDQKNDEVTLGLSAGIGEGSLPFDQVDFLASDIVWPVQLDNLAEKFGSFRSGPFENAPHTALIFPISVAGQDKPYGFLVAGVSSGRALDQEYQNFFELFSNTISTAFSNVDAYQQQQKRAQQLAEIDKAKTAFFSNVSHEFRTPLTLILGPLQEMMDNPDGENNLSVHNRESMYRNAQRLLKLVNNLLDFSRMEAGRVKASYEPVALGMLTADLASNFRSVIESAGMELFMDISPEEPDVFLDTDMWEKIVLNLLSNAFKYTLKGSITVQVKQESGFAVLNVIDTGIGIPENELPHMFERFHRVENAGGRTHEGTGIGLSLVAELVNLHQGTISVSSEYGKGSIFSVRIPLGKNHLAADQIREHAAVQHTSTLQETFIREAMSLLDADQSERVETEPAAEGPVGFEPELAVEKGHVLIVDDNADMRAYIGKLLSPYFSVAYAVNGQDALDKLAIETPDAIVSDVMMPVMDGQQLLSELRALPGSRIPVILLSARAGQESRIEGLDWGADDYLVKPFSAKELVSKVNALVKISNVTRKTESELRNIFMHAPVAIGIFKGKNLVIEVANAIMLRYWGKTSGQVIGLPFVEIFDELRRDGFGAMAQHVFQTGERRMLHNWPVDITRHGKPGKLYINLVMEPLHDVAGFINGVMVVANDVTELASALELVRESEQRFKRLADSMPQLVWRIDKSGGKNFYNDYTYKYSGLTEEQLMEKGLILLVHPDEQADNLAAWRRSVESGEDFVYEHRYRRHDGTYRWHLSRGVAHRTSSGEIESWMGASTDIHDQKTVEEKLEAGVLSRTAELKKINEKLVKTNHELEQFAHVTSHDLQEPLRKIQVFSGMVRDKVSDEDRVTHDYLKRIIGSSERMSYLIRDLLSFARISDSHLTFEKTDLNSVLNQVKEDFGLMIEEKNAEIISEILPVVQAVPLQMNQLFYNLLGNALKFSKEKARIEIYYTFIAKPQADDYEFLEPSRDYHLITFKDYGIGFDQQLADRIFTIFQRLHTGRQLQGTGIGLAICKRIVENHNGVIKAKGEKDVGASFEIYLPVNRDAE